MSIQPGKIVSIDYLVELSKGDQAFIDDMVQIFLEENPQEIKRLEDGLANGDLKVVRAAAHKMRSTIPFVGLDKHIEDEIAGIETLASDDADPTQVMPELQELFTKVKEYCQRAVSELSSDFHG